jgi:hypothetical protein
MEDGEKTMPPIMGAVESRAGVADWPLVDWPCNALPLAALPA